MNKTYTIDMDLTQNIALIDQGTARIICAEKTIEPLIDDICNVSKLITHTPGYTTERNQRAVNVSADRRRETIQLKWIYDTITLSFPEETINFVSDIAEMAHVFEVGFPQATMEKIEKQRNAAAEIIRP